MAITCMPSYQELSFEELRVEDTGIPIAGAAGAAEDAANSGEKPEEKTSEEAVKEKREWQVLAVEGTGSSRRFLVRYVGNSASKAGTGGIAGSAGLAGATEAPSPFLGAAISGTSTTEGTGGTAAGEGKDGEQAPDPCVALDARVVSSTKLWLAVDQAAG